MTWDRDEDNKGLLPKFHDRLLPAASRVDLRLAKRWRTGGGTKAEAALTVQALDGDHFESRMGFLFQRRTFLSLRLEH
jgi:hypothetical protein